MSTTIEIPFELAMGDQSNANFKWTNTDSGFWYESAYRFEKIGLPGPMAGRGLSVWRINVPKNMATPSNWGLVLDHANASGSPGTVLARVEAICVGSGDTPSRMTVIEPNILIGVGASGDRNITALPNQPYDAAVALTPGNELYVQITRMPVNASGDSLVSHWDLTLPPRLRIDCQ